MIITKGGAVVAEPRKPKPELPLTHGAVPFFEWQLSPHDVPRHTERGGLCCYATAERRPQSGIKHIGETK